MSQQISSEQPYSQLARRGKHKIFIGMVSGVGKTYTMLCEAQRLKQQGVDVVIGILETHGRPETMAKVRGLETVPRNPVIQCGLIFLEMDTDAILARQPQLVLVDELAYTNFPGCQRKQRYQDVEALIAAGIDVYSTLNIQHLESLKHAVFSLPGIVIREHIPDRLLQEADEVILVDVTPETLQERLRTGKICTSERIEYASQSLFQRQNLLTLRELALREVANYLEQERFQESMSLSARTTHCVRPVCSVHERVLVCVSIQPKSIQLLHRGASLAGNMNASLYGMFVNYPDRPLTKTELLYLDTCEFLCQDFGGEFLRIDGVDVAATIAQIADTYRITQIIVGMTRKPSWRRLFRQSVIARLRKLLNQSDLHIISTEP